MKRILLFLTVVLAGCATAPARPPVMDGGIVGTGNQVDCEPRKEKDGTPVPLPEECRR